MRAIEPAAYSPLMTAVWPGAGRAPWLRMLALVVAGNFALIVASKVQVPFIPVPMTLQTLAVMLIGASYGWRLAGTTVALWLAEGALGLPVLATAPGGVLGPTGGYLLGFLLAALALGWFAERGWDRTVVGIVPGLLAAEALIMVPGILWLARFVGFDDALRLGAVPFLFGDAVKIMLAACLLPAAWRMIGLRGGSPGA